MRTPAAAAQAAVSTSAYQSFSSCRGARPCWSTKKLSCMACTFAARRSDARNARIEQVHEALGSDELPRSIVPTHGIAPAGERSEPRLGPTRRAGVLHGGEAAT